MKAVVFGAFVLNIFFFPLVLLNHCTWSLYIFVLGEMICLIKPVIHHHLFPLKYMAILLSLQANV